MSQPNPSDRATLSTLAGYPQGPLFFAPDELVTIYVGPEKKPFVIHKEVASYSPVLKAAFNSGFVEGQTQTYNLDNADIGAFQLLVQWLYTKSIQFCLTDAEINSLPVMPNGRLAYNGDTRGKLARHSARLVCLWVIADYLQMTFLQNVAIDGLEHLRVQWGIIKYGALHYLYENVPSEAPLRQLIFEHCKLFLSHCVYQRDPHLSPKQVLIDLIVAKDVREEHNGAQLRQQDPFTDRAEFIKRFHVPEDV